jgi:hypothetical protein
MASALVLPITPPLLKVEPPASSSPLPSVSLALPKDTTLPQVINDTVAITDHAAPVWQVLNEVTLQPLQTVGTIFSRDINGLPLLDTKVLASVTEKALKAVPGTPCFMHAGGTSLDFRFDEIPRQQSIDLAEATIVAICPPGYRYRYVTVVNQQMTQLLPAKLGNTQNIVLELLDANGSNISDRTHVGTGKPESVNILARMSTLNGERFDAGELTINPSAQLNLIPN